MMTDDNRPWARHFQDTWLERAGDPRYPYWLRVAALAYGRHSENGHARFKRGEIALVLATVDEDGVPRPYENVGRAIAAAVEYRWLDPGSYWGCLIVPACSISKGKWGAPHKGCPLADRHSRQRRAA